MYGRILVQLLLVEQRLGRYGNGLLGEGEIATMVIQLRLFRLLMMMMGVGMMVA
jgi:hypothetical protein